MAKPSTARTSSGNNSTLVASRPHSHKIMEGLFLLSALSILFVLFCFFTLELQDISAHALTYSSPESSQTTSSSTIPPRVEARVLGSELVITVVDETGNPTQTLYSSNLADNIADFTLFAIPQTGYRGYIYVRPLLDGNLPLLKVYPLEVSTGTLKAATLNVEADSSALSGDQTLVGTYANGVLTLYALEDGAVVARGDVSSDWQKRLTAKSSSLVITENSCLTLSSPIEEPDVAPFPEICP